MKFSDNYDNEYYSLYKNVNSCLSAEIAYFKRFRIAEKARGLCPVPEKEMAGTSDPILLLRHVSHILCTIIPIVFWFAVARLITQNYSRAIGVDSLLRFIIEFLVIVLPTIVTISVMNKNVEAIVAVITVLFIIASWRSKFFHKITARRFFIGTRPRMLTLDRATISLLTVYCILAIDFETFPKDFRKTRRYGVGLMDTGIGLFVFAMGVISKRPMPRSFGRMLKTVVILLILGILRTTVILAINYSQDEHEYGRDLNAFFTLGLTKYFGAIVSCLSGKDLYLLPLGVAVLTIHEICLQLGVAEFVMSDDIKREDFLSANREGLCSLPGFIGIYIISMYLGRVWQSADDLLNFGNFVDKVKHVGILCVGTWILVIISIFTVSIARVTCNFGYAMWILGIASLMFLLFIIVFDLILNTLFPVQETTTTVQKNIEECTPLISSSIEKCSSFNPKLAIPSIIEAINMNGLVFFLVGNVLTGAVNIFLNPNLRTKFEGYFILCNYMLIAIGVVYALYRRNIRIG